MSDDRRIRLSSRVGVWFALALMLLGCAAPGVKTPSLRSDPVVAVAAPGDAELEVQLSNDAPMARRLSNFRIEGGDWLGFQIVDPALPHAIAAGETVTIHVRVDAAAFQEHEAHDHAPGETHDVGYATYRAGAARLAFDVDDATQAVTLSFEPRPQTGISWGAALCALIVLSVVAAAAIWFGEPPPRGLSITTHDRTDRAAKRFAVLAFVAAVFGLALIPVALPLCDGPSVASVGPLEHARCAQGIGGAPVRLLAGAAPVGLLGVVIAVLLALACAGAGAAAPRRVVSHAMPRVLVLVALFTALAFAGRTLDLDQLIWPASLRLHAGQRASPWPTWMALRHPLAAVLSLWAAGTIFERRPDRPTEPAGRFWIDLMLAVTIAALWFGGGAIPGTLAGRLGLFGIGLGPGRLFATATSAVGFCVTALAVYATAQGLRRHAGTMQLPPGAWVVVALLCAAWIAVGG